MVSMMVPSVSIASSSNKQLLRWHHRWSNGAQQASGVNAMAPPCTASLSSHASVSFMDGSCLLALQRPTQWRQVLYLGGLHSHLAARPSPQRHPGPGQASELPLFELPLLAASR